jgi:hypothetical protein
MNTEIGENINIDDILNIINETLDSKNYLSSSIEYYKNTKGRDIKEEQYKKSWQLKEKIYEINFYDEKIDVSYESINAFCERVIADGDRIPK